MRNDTIQLGIRENLWQFGLLVIVNAFVGGMVGLERTVLPLLAQQEFGLASKAAILSFIVTFGLVKASANFLAGSLSDKIGRKGVLVAGWVVGLPVPFILMTAPSWSWIIVANVLLGINQGLTWTTAVAMKVDLAGPKKRGMALGINEFAGYVALALTALASGYIASKFGVRPYPFYLGVAYAFLGLLFSVFLVKDTHAHAHFEAKNHHQDEVKPTLAQAFIRTSFTNRDLSAITNAGMVNNLNDGMAWGLFPLVFKAAGLSLVEISMLVALYPASWGILQLFTGGFSDKLGRKWLIVAGTLTQSIGTSFIALPLTRAHLLGHQFYAFAAGSFLLGLGTAMVYPTLLAAIGDVVHPTWRASSMGVYRLWRDSGYALGAVIAGTIADKFGMNSALWVAASLTFLSSISVATRLRETLASKRAIAESAPILSTAA